MLQAACNILVTRLVTPKIVFVELPHTFSIVQGHSPRYNNSSRQSVAVCIDCVSPFRCRFWASRRNSAQNGVPQERKWEFSKNIVSGIDPIYRRTCLCNFSLLCRSCSPQLATKVFATLDFVHFRACGSLWSRLEARWVHTRLVLFTTHLGGYR